MHVLFEQTLSFFFWEVIGQRNLNVDVAFLDNMKTSGLLDEDKTSIDPKLNEVVVSSSDRVVVVFNKNEDESSYENKNDMGF